MKFRLFILLAFSITSAQAQSCCGNHIDESFPSVFTRDSVYASSQETYSGNLVNLSLRIYDTQENTCNSRPLLLLVHGGAFGGGSYTQMAELANRFATRGYVVISAGYRLGFASSGALCPTDTSELIRAWYRGMQDIRSSIRWAKERHASLRIDTNLVFLAGWSAGAYISSGIAYLDRAQEKPNQCFEINSINTNGNDLSRPDLGPIEGLSNLNDYSDNIVGFASFSGAFLFSENIELGRKPGALFFNNKQDDYSVPYETCEQDLWQYNCLQGYPTVCGIEAMTPLLEELQIAYDYRVYDTVPCGHSMHQSCFPLFDEEVSIMAEFFNQLMDCNSTTSILQKEENKAIRNLFLESGNVSIPWDNQKIPCSILNSNGSFVNSVYAKDGRLKLPNLLPGIYYLKSSENFDSPSVIRLVIR
ncbi:MAG: alpha/beta hydrolase [Bacteroidia bacterium]